MHLSDWLPTLYGRAGGDVSNLDTDGYDMWPTLSEGQASPRQELVHNIDPVTWTAAVRYQQWKLLVNESKKCVLLLCEYSFNKKFYFNGTPGFINVIKRKYNNIAENVAVNIIT